MKKTLIALMLVCIAVVSANAQILRADELEKYAKERYGEKWVDAATNLGAQLSLDKNNGITFTQVIPAEGRTKEQLYVLLNYWFTSTFSDANSVIQLNDKDLGVIIAQGFVRNIALHIGGMTHYHVSILPVIKCDIKDEKVRVTYTVPCYSVVSIVGGGWFGVMSDTAPARFDQNWTLDTCYPFSKKDSHKKTSCKALVMAHAYSNVMMDKIEECITHGLSGNEDDDW